MSGSTRIYTDVVYGPDYYHISDYEFTGDMIKIDNVKRLIFEITMPTCSTLSKTNEEKNISIDNASFSSKTRLVFWIRDKASLKHPVHSKLCQPVSIEKLLQDRSQENLLNLLKTKAVFLIDKGNI